MPFRLIALGQLSLYDADQTRKLAVPKKALALMAVLASAGSRGMSREKVSSLLWPETADSGRGALKQTIYELRQTLGNHNVLAGTADLSLDAAEITSDVGDLEAAHASGDWARVAELYAGPFLDRYPVRGSAEFDHWVDSRRDRYAEQFRNALEKLAVTTAERGDAPAAVALWRRLAGEDALNSRIALGLINALAAAGDSAGALTHYRVHKELLREELGTQPDAALTSAVEHIRSGKAGPAKSEGPPTKTPGDADRIDDNAGSYSADPSSHLPRKRVTTVGRILLLLAIALAIVAVGKLAAGWPDRRSARELASVELPANSSSRVIVNPQLNKIYVDGGASFEHALTVVTGHTDELRRLPHGSGVAFDPATQVYWTGDYGGRFVVVRNGRTNVEIGRVAVPGCPHQIVIDGPRAWVAQQCDDHISVIDSRTRTVIRHIPVSTLSRAEVGGAKGMGEIFVNRPTGIVYFWKDMIPHRLDPRSWEMREISGIDGPIIGVNDAANRLYARVPNGLQVVDGSTERVVARVKLADTPARIAVGFDGRRIYVAMSKGLSAIDAETHRVIWTTRFPDGFAPGGVAADEGRNRLYLLGSDRAGRSTLKIMALRP